MTKFKIPIEWKCCGEIEVEAETLYRAIRRVEVDEDELPFPNDWDLVEGSIEVNHELSEVYNPGHKLTDEFQLNEEGIKAVIVNNFLEVKKDA